MRRRYHVRSLISIAGGAQINRVIVTRDAAVLEDEAVCRDTLLLSQIVDHGIYAIPRQLLARLRSFSMSGNNYPAIRALTHAVGYIGQQGLLILSQTYRTSLEGNARQNTQVALCFHQPFVAA